jgi:hypothetical protein
MFEGTVKIGASASKTVIMKDAVAVLPAPSVALQVTVVSPRGKVEPEGGVQSTEIVATLSVAVGDG